MRLFVTGATGFVGGRLVRRLRADRHQVAALVRDPARAGALAALGVELFPGDITDRATVEAAMRGADGVFHLAGWYRVGVRDRSPAWCVNVEGTRHVLEAMRALGIPKGVYTSTLAAFGDTRGALVDEDFVPTGPWPTLYDRTKWEAHYRVALPMMREGLPLVIVQPGFTYGPGDTSPLHQTLVRYLRRRLPGVPRDAAYCWAHVEDTAHAHQLALERGRAGQSYIVAGPRHSMAEALAIAERVTGVPAPRRRLSAGALRAMAALMDAVGAVLPVPEGWAGETLRGAAVTYLGSNAKARRELGYDPRPLERGFPEALEWEMRRLGMARAA